MKKILVTGCAGFIGYHLCLKILENRNYKLYGIDNINSYYDTNLKKKRIEELKKNKKFNFNKIDISNKKKIKDYLNKYKFDYFIHLAAQAGVRYSFTNPDEYLNSNIIGFYNILENIKNYNLKHFIFASTSSVYGNSNITPFKETDDTDKPVSFYAASKKINEIMAYPYSLNYKIPMTGLRFFTVYGPYGRPDMALFKFVKNIISNKSIDLYNNGNHQRDFTYIDDVTTSIIKVLNKIPKPQEPFNILNIGSNNPKKLINFVNIIESILKKKAKKNNLKFQIGDVKKTHANINKIKKLINYSPRTNLTNGINNFIDWYKKFYK